MGTQLRICRAWPDYHHTVGGGKKPGASVARMRTFVFCHLTLTTLIAIHGMAAEAEQLHDDSNELS